MLQHCFQLKLRLLRLLPTRHFEIQYLVHMFPIFWRFASLETYATELAVVLDVEADVTAVVVAAPVATVFTVLAAAALPPLSVK
jgi:glycerol-3-phosphate acyltransferase PlsY